MKILKKISVATACSIDRKTFKTLTAETPILRVAGIVRKAEMGEHPQFGAFFKFGGDFTAIDLATGEKAISAVIFLPNPVDELLYNEIKGMEGDDKKGPIEFAFDISVVPDPKTEVGFQYRMNALLEVKHSDPLAALVSSLGELPALAAPTPAPDAEAAPADVAKGGKKK